MNNNDAEVKAVLNAVLDYIEGWYTSDGSRMERALFDKLKKRHVTADGETWEVDKPWMIEATNQGRGKNNDPVNALKQISILCNHR